MLLALLIFFVPPDTFGALPAFFIIFFLAVFFPTTLVFASPRRGFLVAFGLLIFLLFRFLGIGNILNATLLLGIILSVEFYLSR